MSSCANDIHTCVRACLVCICVIIHNEMLTAVSMYPDDCYYVVYTSFSEQTKK